MTTIWVVSSGTYDDYSVDAVYDNADAANTHAGFMNRPRTEDRIFATEYRVEEWGVSSTPETEGLMWVYTASNGNFDRATPTHTRREPMPTRVLSEDGPLGVVVQGTNKDEVQAKYDELKKMKTKKKVK